MRCRKYCGGIFRCRFRLLCFIVFVSSTFRITHAKTKVENTTQFSPEGNSNKTKQNSNVSIPELFDAAVLDEVPLISEVAEDVELSDQSEGVKTTPIPSSTKKNVEGNIKADTSINVEDMDIVPNSFDEISNETSVTSLGNIAKSLPTEVLDGVVSKKEDESSVEFIVTENTDLGLNSSEEIRDIKTDVVVDSEKTIEHVIGNDNTNNLDFDDESPEGKERNSLEKYRDKMLEKHAEKKVKEEKKGKDKKKVKEQEGVDSYVADIPTTETSAVTAESSIHDTVDTSDEDSDTATVEVTNAVTKATDDIQKFNFASFDAGAKMLRVSDGIEASDVILKNDNDKYMMTPCASNVWWLVVQLSEDIAVTSISLSNYEHYASSVKRFQVLGSSQYPTEGWILLGQFTASKERGVQEFTMPKRVWARYLKLRILSHYGSEFYCTLTSFKAHGYTALEGFRDEMVKMSEEVADFQNLLEEDEKLPDNDVSNNDINGSDSSKIETSDSDSVKDETIGDEDDLSGVKQSGESEDNRKVVDEVVDIDDSQKQLNVDDVQTIEDNDGTIIGSEDLSKQNEDQKVDDPLEIRTRPLNGEENKTSIDELQYLPDNEKNNSQNEIQQIPDIIEDNNPSPSTTSKAIDSNGNDSSSMSTNKNANETKEDVKIDEGESSTELVPDICENCDENGTSVSSHNVDMTVNSDVTKSTTSHNDSYDDKARTAESDSVSDNNSKDINRNGKELINQVKNADEVDKTLNSASSLSNNGDKNYVTDTQVTVDSKRGNDPMKKEVVNNTVDKNTLEKNSTSAPSGTDKASNPDSTQDKSAADAIKEATAAVMDKLSSTGLIPSTVDEDKTVSQTGPVAKVKAVVLELLGHDKNPVEKVEASDNDTPTKDNEVVEENVDATGEKSTEKGFQNVPSSAETEISSTSKVDSENIPTINEDRPKQGIPTIKEDRPKQGIDPRTLSQDLDAKSVETITNKSVKNDTISSESKPKREKSSIESTERKQIETKTKEEKRQSTQQRPKSSESMLNVFETISSQMKQIKMSQTVLEQFVNDMNTKLLSGLSTMKKSVSHVSTLTAEVAEAANGYKLAAVERKRIMEDYAAYKESILHFNKTTSKAMSELRISIAASSAAAVAGAGEAIHAVGLQSAGESMALQHQIWLQQMYMVLLGSWLLLICLRSILLTIIFACIFAVAPDEVRIPLLLICMFYYHLNSRDEVQRNSRDRKVRSWRRWCILLPYNFMCRVLRFTCCGFQLPCCRVVAWIYRCFLPREEGGVSSEVNGTMRRNMKTPSNNRSYLKWDKKHRVRRDIDRDYDSDSYSYYSDEQTPVWYSVPNRDRRMFSKYLGRDMRKKFKKRDSNVYIVKSRSSSDFGGDGDHTNQKMSSLRRRLITYSRTRSKSSVPIQNLSSAIDSPTISSPKYKVSNSLQESTEEFHSTQKENISSTNPPFVSQSSDIYNSKKKKGNQCEAD